MGKSLIATDFPQSKIPDFLSLSLMITCCWFCYNTDIQHLYQHTKHSLPHVLISFTTTLRDRYWFKSRSPGSERPSDSSKITELISDGWELDLGPQRQFQGQPLVSCGACSMYEPTRAHTACSWEKLDLGLEAITGVHLSDLQWPGASLVRGTSYCSEISLCLGWGQPPHRQLPANDWGGRGPSWETWSSSGWLVTLSQAPFDLAQRSFIGRIHSIFLLLFYSRLMAGPLSSAPWSVPGSHFSKDWAYHSLPHSFVLMALWATSSGLGSWQEGGVVGMMRN